MDCRTTDLILTHEQIVHCCDCPLYATRANAISGSGAADAAIMFVGGTPSEVDDEQGRAFVGRSGKILRQMMKDAGIRPDNVFMTHAIKCRPPKDRKPTSDEIDECAWFLTEQLRLVQPKFIVLVGAIPTKSVLGLQITQHRGQIIKRGGVTYIPIFHPSNVIRKPKAREVLMKDLIKIRLLERKEKQCTTQSNNHSFSTNELQQHSSLKENPLTM